MGNRENFVKICLLGVLLSSVFEISSACTKMSVVEEYIVELDETIKNIDTKLQNGQVQDCEALLGQADDLLKQMNVEIRSLDSSERGEQKLIYDDYKSRIEAKRTEVKNVKQSSDRKALFGDTNGNQTHKERFMTANERLERQNETILNARRTVAETEEVGAEINENLAMNREKIESSHMKVKELQADLDSADRITKSMVDRSKCSIM